MTGNTLCPACEVMGRLVSPITIEQMVSAAVDDASGWRFCASTGCEVVYYSASQTVTRSDVRVPVFQKGVGSDRLVCYCFEHSVGDVHDAMNGGNASVFELIALACKEGRDQCEIRNPQGRCCLGNVRAVMRGHDSKEDATQKSDCCRGAP